MKGEKMGEYQNGGRDIFALAREADFVAYAETFLGVEFVNPRTPKCLCPFHDDKDPSFSVWVRKNIGKCFSCGETADIIDFTAKVCGLTPKEAAEKIVGDLGL